MKIGIIGSRGIPNHHGGFEQFAEYFSVFLANQNIEVTVYNSSLHPYNLNTYKSVKIITCKDPEDKLGTAGQFIYDLNCILDARKRDFDIILQLGYTSSSIWHRFLPKKSIIVTNMDGLEWKRSKYNIVTKWFLKYAEKLAAIHSDYLISDSEGIKKYLAEKYVKQSKFIAYGANIFDEPDVNALANYDLEQEEYNLIIARIEPENNIEIILDGVVNDTYKTIIIGDADKTKFGKYLKEKYKSVSKIIFLGAIYDTIAINNLRYYSRIYFHGHSVGGTNPSLLEAMSCSCRIIANDNPFNKSVLQNDALYFKESSDVEHHLKHFDGSLWDKSVNKNIQRIKKHYSWQFINESYLNFFNKIL
jgi:glycosyltransferase involved in cell wall biosynthesis